MQLVTVLLYKATRDTVYRFCFWHCQFLVARECAFKCNCNKMRNTRYQGEFENFDQCVFIRSFWNIFLPLPFIWFPYCLIKTDLVRRLNHGGGIGPCRTYAQLTLILYFFVCSMLIFNLETDKEISQVSKYLLTFHEGYYCLLV